MLIQFDACTTADAMFAVFSIFDPLIARPGIRDVLRRFEQKILNHVEIDVAALQAKANQHERAFTHNAGLPPVAADIVRVKQVSLRLAHVVDLAQRDFNQPTD